MKKLGRIAIALVAVFVLTFGNYVASDSIHTADAANAISTIGSTSVGDDWKSGNTGFTAGCALSEWLGMFKCHSSQVPW